MRWLANTRDDRPDAAARFRREHEAWLTWAFASGSRQPMIPLRRVQPSEEARGGGFNAMMARDSGRRRAERWWNLALARVEARPKGLGHG